MLYLCPLNLGNFCNANVSFNTALFLYTLIKNKLIQADITWSYGDFFFKIQQCQKSRSLTARGTLIYYKHAILSVTVTGLTVYQRLGHTSIHRFQINACLFCYMENDVSKTGIHERLDRKSLEDKN